MEQLNIQIIDIHGKDWGIRKIKTLSWNLEGKLNTIQVDFLETMNMYDLDNEGIKENILEYFYNL